MELFDSVRDVFDGLDVRSFTSFSVVGVLDGIPPMLPKSRVPPGVLGVLDAPKDANAPDPKPECTRCASRGGGDGGGRRGLRC